MRRKRSRFRVGYGQIAFYGRSKPFTLIELLIVVAVIAILAALLFPALQGAKRKGLVAVCQSNMKQIGSMNQMYDLDCNGYVPMPGSQHRVEDLGRGQAGYHLANMTRNIACPYGEPRLYPSSFGWFYALGYLPAGSELGVLHCPDMPPFRNYGVSAVNRDQKDYQAISRLTKDLVRNDGLFTHPVWWPTWDCEPCLMSSYSHRGWRRSFREPSAGGLHQWARKTTQWSPNEAVAVDYEFYDSWNGFKYGAFYGSHRDGLNILFLDGSVVFGGKRINGFEPFVYVGMQYGLSYESAANLNGTGANSGRVGTAAWNDSQLDLWRYYEQSR
jgi:prepilin-type N-terminal cleavage/methylation domain-containing protein/prepilin-type processing-associated H-X9-DG protein